MSISEIANKAADIIEKHGLAKSMLKDFDGSYCARGAVMSAVTGFTNPFDLGLYAWYNPDYKLVDAAFTDFVQLDTAEWNNAPERTKEEVVQAFRDLAIKHQPDETGGC